MSNNEHQPGQRPRRELPPVTVELVRDALSFISPDGGHDERAKLAGSIYSELGESGKDAWMDWAGSRSAPSLQEDRDTWKSAKRFTRVKIGTLFGRAKDSGFRFPEFDKDAPKPDAAFLAAERAKREAKAAAVEAEYRARADQAARDARTMWADAVEPTDVAGYLVRKGVAAHGVRMLDDGTLLVPMIDLGGELQNLQRIAPRKPEGDKPEKRFLSGGRKSGLCHLIGAELAEVEGLEVLLAAEGYATAASIHEATGRPVLVCFDRGNLVTVIKLVREQWPLLPLLVCADDDRDTEAKTGKNPGRDAALSCVRAADTDAAPCGMVLPAGLSEGQGTDFNDLMFAVSREAVAQVVGSAVEALLAVDDGAEAGEDAPPPWMDEVPAEEPAKPRLVVSLRDETPTNPKGGGGGEASGGDVVDRIAARYTLVYCDEVMAWDSLKRIFIKIQSMRLVHGREPVNAWLARPSRRMVDLTDMVFEPGQEVGPHQINMYSGLGVQPVKCSPKDVEPMLQLLRHLCAESAETADDVDNIVHWVLCWLALPLQKIGTKMQTALVFHGPQGTGKNLFFDMWRDCYGEWGTTVGQAELEQSYNGWVSRKMAIVADEVVSRAEMYHKKNALKALVTQEAKFPINDKFKSTRWESNHVNFVFTSNENQPLALDDGDRRYTVVYTPMAGDEELYQAVRRFREAGGLGKWLYYLQQYDVGDFTAHSKPPMTRAKADLISFNWRASQKFAHEWTGGFLDLPVRVCSADQLYRVFKRWADRAGERWPPSKDVFGAEVKRWAKETTTRDPVTGRRGDPLLDSKPVTYATEDGRKSMRIWIPAGCVPPAGQAEGAWGKESADKFQSLVDRFCAGRFGSGGEEA